MRRRLSSAAPSRACSLSAALASRPTFASTWRRPSRLVDQYPLYAAYLSLAASQRATSGASSLHYSATSSADRLVLPDLGAMRVQFSLDALCSKQSWEPPCGAGRDSAPECHCTSMALSTGGRARFRKVDEELRTHKTVRVPTASLYVHLVKVCTTNGTAAPSTLARIAATASSRGIATNSNVRASALSFRSPRLSLGPLMATSPAPPPATATAPRLSPRQKRVTAPAVRTAGTLGNAFASWERPLPKSEGARPARPAAA